MMERPGRWPVAPSSPLGVQVEFLHTDDSPTCLDPSCPCQQQGQESGPVLVAGRMSPAAGEWLEKHGARLLDAGAVWVVFLPPSVIVERKGYWWRYHIVLFDSEGFELEPGLVYELSEDSRESVLTLRSQI